MRFAKSTVLVGAGRWGKNLARNLHSLGALHSICDICEATLDQYEGVYPGVQLSSNFSALLDSPEVQRVFIASSAFTHFELAQKAMEAGKDVFVEKPLCVSPLEVDCLTQLADDKGRILMTGHLLQYHPAFIELLGRVTRGELGKIQYIFSNRMDLGTFRVEENALWNFAPHDVSMILALCGNQLPERVQCSGMQCLHEGVVDNSLVSMVFPGGMQAHLYCSWMNAYKEQRLVVQGTEATAVFDDVLDWEHKLCIYRGLVKWNPGNRATHCKKEGEYIPLSKGEPLRNECAHFLRCCEERSQPISDGHEALRVLKVVKAAQESLEEEGRAKNPEAVYRGLSKAGLYYTHPTAELHPSAHVGQGSKVWHFSHIMEGAVLGECCNLGQNVVVSPGVTLGDRVKIQNNVSIYSGVSCEEDVFIGPSVVFTNIRNPRSEVSRKEMYEKTYVRRGATIGANATVLCGIEIGHYAFIGAGALVCRDVKPYALVVGSPARQVGWMSRHGDRLDLPVELASGESQEASCPSTGEIYSLEGDQLIARSHCEGALLI